MHRGRANHGKSSIMHNGLMPAFGTVKRRAVMGASSIAEPSRSAAEAHTNDNKEKREEVVAQASNTNTMASSGETAAQKRPRSSLDDVDGDSSEDHDGVGAAKVSIAEEKSTKAMETPPISTRVHGNAANVPIDEASSPTADKAKPTSSSAGSSGSVAVTSSIAAFTSDTLFRRKAVPKKSSETSKSGGPADAKFLGSFFK